MYARTNYLLLCCDRFIGYSGGRASWHVEVLHEPAPILDTISVVDRAAIDRRFENGDQCFLVHNGLKCLGCVWGHTGDCYIIGAAERLSLDPQSVYLYGVFTIEEMRRKGIYDAIQAVFFRYYMERNMTRAYTMIEKNNIIMKKVFLKAGFKIKSHIHYVRYHKRGIRYVHDYESGKMAVQYITREPRDCAII